MVDRVERSGVFRWNRKPLKVKTLSTLLYYSGLSYRVVARVLRGLARFSHESVRLWFRRLRKAFPRPERKCRSLVAVDETKLKLCGEHLYVWAAIDIKTKEVLACRVSWTRNIMQAEALRTLGLKWRHVTFGMRNRIERWFGILKARTKRFHNNFPKNSTIKSVKTYIETFATLPKTKT